MIGSPATASATDGTGPRAEASTTPCCSTNASQRRAEPPRVVLVRLLAAGFATARFVGGFAAARFVAGFVAARFAGFVAARFAGFVAPRFVAGFVAPRFVAGFVAARFATSFVAARFATGFATPRADDFAFGRLAGTRFAMRMGAFTGE
jgi:hypothetical protein